MCTLLLTCCSFSERFVWVKPSRNPGVLSSLQYTIVIYEKAGVYDESSSAFSVLLFTLVAIALGAAAFWKFGRPGAGDTPQPKKEENRGFRWLREEGNDLIPLSELATRKQYVSLLEDTTRKPMLTHPLHLQRDIL